MEVLATPRAPRRVSRYLTFSALWVTLVSGTFTSASPARAADIHSEDAVKAAYLYRFASYIDWPAESSASKFVIAVLDSPDVTRELTRLLPAHLIENRAVEIRPVSGVRDLDSPAILFVGAGHADSLRTLLPSLAPKSTLIVTDEEGGLNAGSVLNFLTVDRRVRFEVSLTAADRARLKISSELLAVAVRVIGGRRQSRDGCGPEPDAQWTGDCAMREVRSNPAAGERAEGTPP